MDGEGLFVPFEALKTYNFEQALITAALWEVYREQGYPQGVLSASVSKLLARLGKADNADNRDELEGVMYSLHRTHRMGFKIDLDTLTLWFPPDVQRRIASYRKENPDG